MIKPPLLPDEFVVGYLGRVRQINQQKCTAQTLHEIQSELSVHFPDIKRWPIAAKVATFASETLEDLIRRHSMAPFLRAVEWRGPGAPSKKERTASVIPLTSIHGPNPYAALCPDCIAEDMNYWRFSYWRRSHQLPGLCTCSKHGTLLLAAPLSAFEGTPLHAEREAVTIFGGQSGRSPLVKRYAEIAQGFLDMTIHPIPQQVVAHRLYERAITRRLRGGVRRWGPNVQAQAVQSIPLDWADAFWPGLLNTTHSGKLQRTLFSPSAAHHCALVLAVLFDDADEALTYWYGTQEPDSIDSYADKLANGGSRLHHKKKGRAKTTLA